MPSLKRHKKTGELIEATGILAKSQMWRAYKPNQEKDFKLSRSRFDDFKTCPKCFYLRTVKGFSPPSSIPFKLNTLTDTLLKKEFDVCRKEKKPHRLFKKYNLDHVIPFDPGTIKKIKDKQEVDVDLIDVWRDSLHGGLSARFKNSNIILYGGIDDVWFDTKTEELIVADYKSQEDQKEVNQSNYFDKPYRDSYKRQLDFYAYLLTCMGHKVSKKAYLYICNAKELESGFNGAMHFDELLIEHEINNDYLEKDIQDMIDVMNSDKIPESHKSCEDCAYSRQRVKLK